MSLLNQVKKMQEQGIQDSQISQQLAEQGYSPKEINDSLEQSKIKAAVSQNPNQNYQQQEQYQAPQPSNQNYQEQEQYQAPQPSNQNYQQQEQYQAPQSPQSYNYEQYQPYSSSAGNMAEIAEQIAVEKVNKVKSDLNELKRFKNLSDGKIKLLDKRLKKIEDTIDNLEKSIIAKVGDYGENIQGIKQEMEMMQETFTKTIPNLSKKHKKTHKKSSHSKKKK